MNGRRDKRFAMLRAGLLAASLAIAPQLSSPAAGADAADGQTVRASSVARHLQMGVGKSVIVDLPAEASEIFVGNPAVANAIVRSARRLYIDAIANGQTSIFALDKDGRQIVVFEVSVGRDIGELQELLRTALPGNDIQVKTVADSIILIGSVGSAGEAQKALDIASGFVGVSVLGGAPSGSSAAGAPSGGAAPSVSISSAGTPVSGKVINSLIIRGLDQVSVRVTVTEIRREILKQLGVSMAGTGNSPNSFTVDNPFAINGAITATEAVLGWTKSNGTGFSATLQAFERQGVARTLAEPTVTAVSGESAKFLAGGSVPVPSGETCPTGGGNCVLTFAYQPYGVTLNFTPVVLSQGRIQLRVATEVTDIDNSKQITVLGTAVPAFRTRRNETTVELPSGGSIVSAGLISTETQQAINGVPGLMNLPILGALFRSRDYQRDETELLIMVTPYIVHAIDPHEIVKPDANYVDATDPQSWLLGRVNRLYSSSGNSQPISNYSGKVGFIND
ncbi:type II and III secretion system protein family protein [Methylocapsa sp. S129]|uniref:type II and III secretion system protein family protein n=1 Tax=Methylocapsa sp. S129 TaxID=1641869 RepID=UPI001FEDC45C|nr:type II and III secretion system protein family protein [Methylocapsa sp. S129]